MGALDRVEGPLLRPQRLGREESAARVDAPPSELCSGGAIEHDHGWRIPQASDTALPMALLNVGDVAPDFVLLAFDGKDLKKVSLQDFHGKKNVALAFYVFAFTGG